MWSGAETEVEAETEVGAETRLWQTNNIQFYLHHPLHSMLLPPPSLPRPLPVSSLEIAVVLEGEVMGPVLFVKASALPAMLPRLVVVGGGEATTVTAGQEV